MRNGTTFYYVDHGHRMRFRRYTVMRRTDFTFDPNPILVVVSRHIFYRRAAAEAGRRNTRRREIFEATRRSL